MRWYHHSIELISLREEQLYKDLNTGLYNRNKLIQDSTEVLYPSIIVFRMKGLNLLNNIYGHSVVDEIVNEYISSIKEIYKSNLYRIYRLN